MPSKNLVQYLRFALRECGQEDLSFNALYAFGC